MIFDNCIIQAPDGVNLSRCGKKKLRWYLNNGLAELVSDNPLTIRLNFEPRGREGLNDPYLLEGKPNLCVVCGTQNNLTRHHIIPYCFIRYMAVEYKVDIIRDIFPLCRPCHDQYEKVSCNKRDEISKRLGIPLEANKAENLEIKKASSAAYTMLNHHQQIPENRKNELMRVISDHLGKKHITENDLLDLQDANTQKKKQVNFSKIVAQSVTDYNEFAKEWRTHFLESMQPSFMPEAWKVDRKTENVWVPLRMLSQN